MRGIVATMWLFLGAKPAQRGLLGIGLLVTCAGLVPLLYDPHIPSRRVFDIIAIVGTFTAAVASIATGGIMFQSVSAPRTVRLIPHGRLQIVTGAFCTHLLIAAFITVTVSVVARLPFANVFALDFGLLTLSFAFFYCSVLFRFGFLVFVLGFLASRLLTIAFPKASPRALLDMPVALSAIVAASVLLWMLLGVVYVRSRRVPLPHGNTVGNATWPRRFTRTAVHPDASPDYAPAQAISIVLSGSVRPRRSLLIVTLIFIAVLAASLLTAQSGDMMAVLWAGLICIFAAMASGLATSMATRRAKYLWLTTGLGRDELFDVVERLGWRTVWVIAAIAISLALALILGSHHLFTARMATLVATPLVSGAALSYAALLSIRKPQPANFAFGATCALLLAAELISQLPIFSAMPLAILLAAQIVVLPLLRHIARRRWQNIDWLINRPIAVPSRLT